MESCLLEDPAHGEEALSAAYSRLTKLSVYLDQAELPVALTGTEHVGCLRPCLVGDAEALQVVSAVGNPLQGEVIAIVCHHLVLLIGVPVVLDNFSLWEGKDSMGQSPGREGLYPEGWQGLAGQSHQCWR